MRSGWMRAALVFASISPQIGPCEAEMRSRLPPVPPFPPHPPSLPPSPPDALTPPSSLALLSFDCSRKIRCIEERKKKEIWLRCRLPVRPNESADLGGFGLIRRAAMLQSRTLMVFSSQTQQD
ncbi:hypothetical protein OJAV_G00123250 [Oryzias javanicus]|uniref:Secreted protein n=1 Tax=Oryzias javanicus TaxID=123683 RepID=A0A437CT79_ORYJA|nr:hypothetical protein OJAV_G00123250 [Oryzias javanicus]